VERRLGGRRVRDTLEKLTQELEDYLGSINELKDGLRKDLLPKPAELILYELVKSTGLPLVQGGLLDQPYLWLRQWEIIETVKKVYSALDKQAQASQPSNLMAPMRLGK
jgi:hypothetical protein